MYKMSRQKLLYGCWECVQVALLHLLLAIRLLRSVTRCLSLATCYLLLCSFPSDTFYLKLAIICRLLSVTCYLLQATCYICYLLSDTFYLKLAIAWKNLLPFARCCTSSNFFHHDEFYFWFWEIVSISSVGSLGHWLSRWGVIITFFR